MTIILPKTPFLCTSFKHLLLNQKYIYCKLSSNKKDMNIHRSGCEYKGPYYYNTYYGYFNYSEHTHYNINSTSSSEKVLTAVYEYYYNCLLIIYE